MNKHLFEGEYSSDALRWLEIHKSIEQHKISYSGDKRLDKIQEDIILSNDSALAYFFSYDTNYKTYKMQEVILKSKDPKYALLFAQNVPNADITALQNIVLDSNRIGYICKFGCFVKGADKKKIEKVITREDSARYAHMFLKNVPQASVKKFKKIILESRKPRYLFELAKHLKTRREISQIENIIIELQSFTYMRLLAQKIKLASVKKLEQAILDSGNTKEIKKFAKAVKKSNIRKLSILF